MRRLVAASAALNTFFVFSSSSVFVSTVAAVVTPASEDVQRQNDDNVPGCDCPASVCENWMDLEGDNFNRMGAMPICPTGLYRDDFFDYNNTRFYNITNQTSMTFCDAVDADPTFQETYGSNAGYMKVVTDAAYGDYLELPSAFTFGVSGIGSCQDAVRVQSSCGNSNDQSEGGPNFNTIMLGLTEGIGSASPLPDANYSIDAPTVNVVSCCLGRSDNGTIDFSVGLGIFLEIGVGQTSLLETVSKSGCPYTSGSTATMMAPFLTHEDWIETAPGRRYMCKEYYHTASDNSDGMTTYYLLVVSLGNEPCQWKAVQEEEEEGDDGSSSNESSSSFESRSGSVSPFLAMWTLIVFGVHFCL